MLSDIFSWVMSYVERLENLTTMEYGFVSAVFAVTMVGLAVVLWKIFRQVEFYFYRKSQLNGWKANRDNTICQDSNDPLRLEHLPLIPKTKSHNVTR